MVVLFQVDDDLFSMLESNSNKKGNKKDDSSLFNIDDYIANQSTSSKGGLFD